jgi:lipoprotein NlpI
MGEDMQKLGTCSGLVAVALIAGLSGFSAAAKADGAADLQACYHANNEGDYQSAVELCGRAAQASDLSAADAAAALNDLGNAYNAQGDYDHAIESYGHAIKRKSDDADAYFDRATAFDGKADFDKAIADYSKAIALQPNDANAYISRGQDYALEGQYAQAIRDYDRVAQVDPGYAAVAAWAEGQALFDLGRFDEAIGKFNDYLQAKPTYTYGALWLYLAQAHAHQDGGPALADRSQSFDLSQWPGPVIQYYLGTVSAEDVLAQSKQGDPAYLEDQACEAAFYIGEFNLVSGRAAVAQPYLTQAAETCPKSSAERDAARVELGRL